MNAILVAVDDSPSSGPVLQVAHRLAETLSVECRPIHFFQRTGGSFPEHRHLDIETLTIAEGDPVTEIVNAAGEDSNVMVVLGSRGDEAGPTPTGHVAKAVIEQACKPVVVVPPGAEQRGPLDRVLVPLEGTTESSGPIAELVTQLSEAGVDLIALHVFHQGTVPRFWGNAAHTGTSFAAEFTSRWWHSLHGPVDVLLRRGDPAATIVEVARGEQVDLIVLGWSQDLSSGRAKVVRAALTETRIPVLLVPTCADAPTPPAGSTPGLR